MASLQAYTSHGIRYYRIVESFRNNGKPSIRVLAHLGRVDDILHRHQHHPDEVPVRISSVSAGAVTALHHLTQELDLAGRINRAISPNGDVQVRDALTRISHTEILNREKWVKSRLRVRFFGLTKKRWSVWAMFRDQKVPSAACGAITGQLQGRS